jgi:pimeloyl-ACP methyl ester carboxylesterase
MASSLPTIVLIPGAWHSPIHYELVTKKLQAAHYDVVSSTLPSLDPSNPNVTTVTTDSTFISEKLLAPLLTEGKDIVLVMHSYGGSPGSVAAHGQSKTERSSKGLEGGIVGIIFIAALLTPEGASLLTMVGGKFNDWVEVNVSFPISSHCVFANVVL